MLRMCNAREGVRLAVWSLIYLLGCFQYEYFYVLFNGSFCLLSLASQIYANVAGQQAGVRWLARLRRDHCHERGCWPHSPGGLEQAFGLGEAPRRLWLPHVSTWFVLVGSRLRVSTYLIWSDWFTTRTVWFWLVHDFDGSGWCGWDWVGGVYALIQHHKLAIIFAEKGTVIRVLSYIYQVWFTCFLGYLRDIEVNSQKKNVVLVYKLCGFCPHDSQKIPISFANWVKA